MPTRQPPQPPSKKDVLNTLLDEGKTMIFLDARVEGVDVPRDHHGNANLCLNLSRRFPRPMAVLEDRVEATLSFGGVGYRCVVPFDAIFGMFSHESHKQFVWPEDVPPEVLDAMPGPAADGDAPAPAPAAARTARARKATARARKEEARSHLRVVPDPPPADDDDMEPPAAEPSSAPAVAVAESTPADAPPDTPPEAPRRPHLRLVK